jgi:hypothetical protein
LSTKLDRGVACDTQGFDGSTIRVSKQYDNLDRVLGGSALPHVVMSIGVIVSLCRGDLDC